MILFMNPLLLDSQSNHVVLQRFISSLLKLPDRQRKVLFTWIADLPSEFFSHVVHVVQRYMEFLRTERRTVQILDATPAALILRDLGVTATLVWTEATDSEPEGWNTVRDASGNDFNLGRLDTVGKQTPEQALDDLAWGEPPPL